ncbi:MAG: hybrid sensor histidine kinase/response regulator, partial [Deferrisomatales bacterium]
MGDREPRGELRRQAEAALGAGTEELVRLGAREAERLVHELRVHEIELELQNEELRTAQVELAAARDRYADLYDFAPVGYFTLDREGIIREANLTGAALLGAERAHLVGRPFSAHVDRSPDDQRALRRSREEVLDGEGRGECELRITRPGAEPFPARLVATAAPDPGGNAPTWRMVVSDLSDRVRLEEQLRQAQRLEVVGQLAGGIAHDFNNLLQVILGECDLVLEKAEAAPYRRRLEQIRRSGERAADLTRQLLAFSRRQILQPRVLDLGDTVRQVEKMLGRLLGEDVTLSADLAPGLWPVRADPGQLEQVLLNLAVNARDAMPHGGRLTIATANVEADPAGLGLPPGELASGPHVRLTVTDTGTGMDAGTLARAFEPFFTTKGVGQGTGLGLSTVYGIVKQSGGGVVARSRPGEGTAVEVYLPRTAPVAAQAEAATPEAPRGTETVLVVEDEATVRMIVRAQLERCGYTVLEAESGPAALALTEARAGPIDLLLTDVVMPGMGGRALAEALAARSPDLRVLYMSGYTDDALVRQGIATAGANFVQKPFSRGALAQKVRQVLDGGTPGWEGAKGAR